MNMETSVLVVENALDQRERIIKCLASAGLSASGVGSAAECYQALTKNNWRIAVVDIDLPDQSGYMLVEYIRANTTMKVIILTARDAADDRVKGYDSGADIYLVKPIKCQELATAIKNLAQRRNCKNGSTILQNSHPNPGHPLKASHPSRPAQH